MAIVGRWWLWLEHAWVYCWALLLLLEVGVVVLLCFAANAVLLLSVAVAALDVAAMQQEEG